ncbi:MAG: hypothetical protein Q9202_004565 [Teloschistes flavicans]
MSQLVKVKAPTKEKVREIAEHGTQIFVYNNIRTNQVVYSLTRVLDNHSALKQLPFLGKKTVPSTIRKDLWHPLCHVSFPRASAGLIAYRRLREFRRLHETSYPLSLIRENNAKRGPLLPKKKRGKILMNQKANTVADLAKVLELQKAGPTEAKVEEKKRAILRVEKWKASGKKRMMQRQPQEADYGGVDGVVIRWANLLDAEFAKSWPEEVKHDGLTAHRYVAAFPEKEITRKHGTLQLEKIVESGKGEVGEPEAEKPEVPAELLEKQNKGWFARGRSALGLG